MNSVLQSAVKLNDYYLSKIQAIEKAITEIRKKKNVTKCTHPIAESVKYILRRLDICICKPSKYMYATTKKLPLDRAEPNLAPKGRT